VNRHRAARGQLSQARGHFPLPQAGRYLLFAGGIGITPLLAMADAIAARKGRG
jgi:ferredoxin-NADP reductase